jgi:hypothetical protein
VDWVHGAVNYGVARVHGGSKAVQTGGAVALCRREACECSGSPVLADVGWGG